jgi:hypothetical protein
MNPVQAENLRSGDHQWDPWAPGHRAAADIEQRIKGYASKTSVGLGESVDFHVTVNPAGEFTISLYRLGWYDGRGARLVAQSPTLTGISQPEPEFDPQTRLITCPWSVSWTLTVGSDWTSGLYLAVFTSAAGYRNVTPLVVRDDERRAALCVLIPFTTYQAYNQWPLDGRRGRSLYYGYPPEGERKDPNERAYQVSYDRPYVASGYPHQLSFDHEFVTWAERCGYDLSYADSADLDAGRIDVEKYRGLVFSGHDEYWTRGMRDAASRALDAGRSLAFLTANNIYWHIRLAPSASGVPRRIVVCYKASPDPAADASGATGKWRTKAPSPGEPEQALLGVQYRAVVPAPAPLVVTASGHWFWAGCEVRDGDEVPDLVAGEADSFQPNYPVPRSVQQTLLAQSPYTMSNGTPVVHHASICERDDGTFVFVGGTLHWTLGLSQNDQGDGRIQRATTNLLDRMIADKPPAARRGLLNLVRRRWQSVSRR